MGARADQLVLDYLSRVADEACGVLRSDERLRLVTRLRAAIEQQRHTLGASGLAGVRNLLDTLGDPKLVVERERRRLDAAARGAGGLGTASEPAPSAAAGRAGGPASGPRARHDPQTAFDLMPVTRAFGREVLALMLLTPGGLLLWPPLWPVLWLIGTVLALASRTWSRPDKFIGLAGPLVVTVAGIVIVGALNKNPSMGVDLHSYVAAAQVNGRMLLRACAMAGVVFLGARLLRPYRAALRRSADR